jgi:AraC-like DNA-binding protein
MMLARTTSHWPSACTARSIPFEDYCAPAHGGPALEWTYERPSIGFVLSGWFEYENQSAKVLVGPGALILGNAGEQFTVQHLDSRGNRRLVVTLDQAIVDEVANAAALGPRFSATVIPPGRSSTYACGLIRSVSRGNDNMLLLLARAALGGSCDEPAPPCSASDRSRVRQVIGYIEANFDQPCSLDSMASAGGVSRYHLVRIFRAAVGITPNRYLSNVRLRAAADLLTTSKAPIAEIIYRVGFNDISHFYSCFRETYRCTPREWRLRA